MDGKFKKLALAILKGQILLYFKADKYLMQIIFFFVMAILFIWANLGMDMTLHTQEQNKRVIENLKSLHTELKCTLTNLNSVCTVESKLKEMESNVGIPQEKAIRIE